MCFLEGSPEEINIITPTARPIKVATWIPALRDRDLNFALIFSNIPPI